MSPAGDQRIIATYLSMVAQVDSNKTQKSTKPTLQLVFPPRWMFQTENKGNLITLDKLFERSCVSFASLVLEI